MQVNMHEAKTQLSKLVEAAAAGEDVVIAKAGVPRVRLVPVEPARKSREPGLLRGQIWVADDFDAPDPELERLFAGDAE